MASDVDIANMALAHLGDATNVASISPPEASPQARWCARFFPVARDAVLEMHEWNFATRRQTGALIASTIDQWQYSYAMPANAIKVLAVLDSQAQDDYGESLYVKEGTRTADGFIYPQAFSGAVITPQDFVVETLEDGTKVIYTNQKDALIRYIARVTDASKFSSLFSLALSYMLASFIAGPMLKGATARAVAKEMLGIAQAYVAEAKLADTQQRKKAPVHVVPWMAAR